MQKIRYVNPLGDTVEITPLAPPYIFESVHGVCAADTTMIVHTPAGLDGALFHGLLLNDREVTVNLHVWGETREAMYRNRLELTRLLGSSLSRRGDEGQLWYENDYGAWWTPAVVKQGVRENGSRTKNYVPLQVVFYCPDAAWRASDATLEKLAYLFGGFKFPLKIPAINQPQPGVKFGLQGYRASIHNDGDAPAPIELEISGPATRPKIEHKDTGGYIAINRELASGDRLLINTERGRKSAVIIRANGKQENAMGYVDPSSTWFFLLPGENLLEYTSGNDTTSASVIVRTWSRYGGV